MTITHLLIQNGVTGYNAETNISWQSLIPPIEVINHFINLDISSGNPYHAAITALRSVIIKFDSYDKYSVHEIHTSINTHRLSS